MIVQTYYATRPDGVVLIRTYSDNNVWIQNQDGVLYEEAIDPQHLHRTYTETNIPIEPEPVPPEDISAEELVNILIGGEDE